MLFCCYFLIMSSYFTLLFDVIITILNGKNVNTCFFGKSTRFSLNIGIGFLKGILSSLHLFLADYIRPLRSQYITLFFNSSERFKIQLQNSIYIVNKIKFIYFIPVAGNFNLNGRYIKIMA